MAKTYQSFGVLAAAAAAAGVLVAVGMLMLTMLVVDKPAEAAFPGQNGKIAFTSSRDGNFEIYTMNPNGQGVDNLTKNAGGDADPNWSPDGNKIAFVSSREGNNTEIYTMNANGQGVDNLTKNPGLDESPAWSPDGNKIAFYSERSGDSLIYTINPNSQGLDPLTTKNDYDPDWQPLSPAPNPTPPNPTPPNPTPPNNTTAPKVLKTFPKANAKGVAPTVSLKATFSEKMQPASLKSAFKLFNKNKGSTTNKLSARVSYKAATKQATLDPTTSLRRGVTYKAVVSTGAKDVAGKPYRGTRRATCPRRSAHLGRLDPNEELLSTPLQKLSEK